jgi:hypothetical protein
MEKNEKFEKFSNAMWETFKGWKAVFDIDPKHFEKATGLTTDKKLENMFLVVLDE